MHRFKLARSLGCGLLLAWLCGSPVFAGLIRIERASPAALYTEIKVASLASPELQRHWHDQIDYVDLTSPVGATIYRQTATAAGGRALTIEMLIAMPACGIRECPVRVYSDRDDLLIDTMGCTEAALHTVSADGHSVSICGAAHRIPDVAASPASAMIKPMWHNGSLMEASFLRNGDVRIVYRRPKPALSPQYTGQLVFEGRLDQDGGLSGTAYTFKTGCAPAAYAVRGSVHRRAHVLLTGDAPVRDRQGCALRGVSAHSANARLEFTEAALDAVN